MKIAQLLKDGTLKSRVPVITGKIKNNVQDRIRFQQSVAMSEFTDNNITHSKDRWVPGTTGSQTFFSRNGDVSENRIILDENAFGEIVPVWDILSGNVDNGADGGWNTSSFPVDHTKMYRFTVWVRVKVPGHGRTYFGTHGYGSTNGVIRISDNANYTNPYFVYHTAPTLYSAHGSEWRLQVAYVLPSDTAITGSRTPLSGIYAPFDMEKRQNTLYDYKWRPETVSANQRCYLYYDAVGDTRMQYCDPRVDLCDGTEPSLEDLIFNNVSVHRPAEVRKFRYIRDHINGSTSNTGNHWCSIEAYNERLENVALNMPITNSSGGSAATSTVTDGTTGTTPYYSVAGGAPAWVQVDLGTPQALHYINVRHYYSDGRTYHKTFTEVSEDGISWYRIRNYTVDGEYKETSSGIIMDPNRKMLIKSDIEMLDIMGTSTNFVTDPTVTSMLPVAPADSRDPIMHNGALYPDSWTDGRISTQPDTSYHAFWVESHGDTNLIMKNLPSPITGVSPLVLAASTDIGSAASLGLSVGDEITVSADIVSSTIGQIGTLALNVARTGSNPNNFESSYSYTTDISDEWVRISKIMTVGADWDLNANITLVASCDVNGVEGTLRMKDFQVEKGKCSPFFIGTQLKTTAEKSVRINSSTTGTIIGTYIPSEDWLDATSYVDSANNSIPFAFRDSNTGQEVAYKFYLYQGKSHPFMDVVGGPNYHVSYEIKAHRPVSYVLTYSGTDVVLYIFQDGMLLGTHIGVFPATTVLDTFVVGSDNSISCKHKELEILDTALTSTEVLDLFDIPLSVRTDLINVGSICTTASSTSGTLLSLDGGDRSDLLLSSTGSKPYFDGCAIGYSDYTNYIWNGAFTSTIDSEVGGWVKDEFNRSPEGNPTYALTSCTVAASCSEPVSISTNGLPYYVRVAVYVSEDSDATGVNVTCTGGLSGTASYDESNKGQWQELEIYTSSVSSSATLSVNVAAGMTKGFVRVGDMLVTKAAHQVPFILDDVVPSAPVLITPDVLDVLSPFTIVANIKPLLDSNSSHESIVVLNSNKGIGNTTNKRLLVLTIPGTDKVGVWFGADGSTEYYMETAGAVGIDRKAWNTVVLRYDGLKLTIAVFNKLGIEVTDISVDMSSATAFDRADYAFSINQYSDSPSKSLHKNYEFIQSALSDKEVVDLYNRKANYSKNLWTIDGDLITNKGLI